MDPNWALVVLTGGLILVTGYYAWQNKRLVDEMRQQNAIEGRPQSAALRSTGSDLGAVGKLSATALQVGDLPMEVVERFARDVGAARYLLDEAEASIISEMIKRAITVSTRADALRQMLVEDDEKAARRERQLADLVWFDEQSRNLTVRFEKYLKLGSL